MSWSVRDAIELEKRGVVTATVCSAPFLAPARAQAQHQGMPSIPVVKIAHPMATASRAAVAEQARRALPDLARALTAGGSAGVEAPQQAAPAGDLLTVDGGVEEVNERFHERGWTDGLPIIPPTEENVRAMLSRSPYPADRVLGAIPPSMARPTVQKLAVSAVMAGCRPDYFPVVVAAVEALADEDLALYSMQTATNATAPLVIVNGPAVEALGLNAGGNLFGQGCRANATIGRAVRLILTTVGGEVPGVTDPSTHGQPGKYTFCIAEAEDESPWEPLHVELGYGREESTVTLVGAGGPQNLFTYGCRTGREILDTFVGALCGLGHNNILFPTGPLLVLSPEHAATLAGDGFGKREVREFLFERARIPLSRFAEGTRRGILERRARWFETVGDPDHIGIADRPEDIVLVVAGGAGIHSQFLTTAFSRRPVTRVVSPPAPPSAA